jgi:hypothetical protein
MNKAGDGSNPRGCEDASMDYNGSSYWVDRKQTADLGAQPDRKTSDHGLSIRGASTEENKKVRVGYGLPCAHCKAYYAADLAACPYCGSADRVTASATPSVNVSAAVNEPLPLHAATGEILPGGDEDELDPAQIENRERVLREYQNQVFAANPGLVTNPQTQCTLDKNHQTTPAAPAVVCKDCYNEVAIQCEQLEAALCMDAREAAQIIYEAVWADPSPTDPSRTYQNAASAVLNEIRRRAGLAMPIATVAPYTH